MTSRRPPEIWRRNLYIVWSAQCLTIIGFSFIFPFIPLFMQGLGVSDPAQAALWSGLASGAMGLSLFLFGPIWGILGDRYGRKKNVLRAMFATAVLLALTGFAATPLQVVLLRFLTGMVSGVFAPSMALVASGTPRNKMGYAMGILQSAMAVGGTVGPLFGGFLFQAVGYRGAFFAAGASLAVAGAVVAMLVREDFHRPAETPETRWGSAFRGVWDMATSRQVLPLLAAMFMVMASQAMMSPVLPVLVRTLGDEGRAASSSGIALAIQGLTISISSYGAARLASRGVSLARLMTLACIGAGLMYVPLVFVGTVPLVILFVGLTGLFQGGLQSAAAASVGMAVPRERHGAAYGAVQSAASMAMGTGPLLGGAIATGLGLRAVFVAEALVFLTTAALVIPRMRLRAEAGPEESPPGKTL